MADVITRFKVETQDYDRKISQSRQKLKDFEKGGQEAGSTFAGLSDKFNLGAVKVAAMSAAVAGASAAVAIAKDAFMACESNIDEWGRTVEGAKGAYDVFLQSLTTGNWSDFLNRLNEAVSGARDLYDAMDRLGSVKANNKAAIAVQQKVIQDLRLKQSNGEDVTAQLETATAELARLQGQEVEAGLAAGTKKMVETLRNGGVSSALAPALAEELAKGGQDAFDKYDNILTELTKKGTKAGGYQSKFAGLITYYDEGGFDINNLSKEEQTLYNTAKAVKERETALQEGISIYADAVTQGASSSREQNKNIKYAGGGSGSSGSKAVTGLSSEQIASNIADTNSELSSLITNWIDAGQAADEAITVFSVLNYEGPTEWIDEADEGLDKLVDKMYETQQAAKASGESFRTAMNATSQLGGAIASLENPAAKVMGTIAQAIATVALSYAETLAKDKASKSNIYAFIAAAAASTISMVSTISAIKSNAKFANGGIVGGSTYSGDQIDASAYVNSGELILNRAQQNSIANQLQNASGGFGGRVEFKIRDSELVGILQNYNDKKSHRV